MSENLNKKIIELESKFSILIKKYNELKSINNKLNEELTEKEIELIIKSALRLESESHQPSGQQVV